MKNKIKESMEYKNYKLYRDKINHLIRASKKIIINHTSLNINIIPKRPGHQQQQVISGNRKKSTTRSISLPENTKDVANIFNNYIVNLAENLSKELGHPKYSVDTHLENPNKYNFFITPTDPQEVLKLINDIDPKKASDVYNISPRFIKDSKFFLADALCKLSNVLIEDQCFPDTLKFAKVLHKGKSTMDCKNYRPISLLPISSKIIEKLMYERLLSFINKHNILSQHQYGFQSGKSTELAINSLLGNVNESFEEKKITSVYSLILPKLLTRTTIKSFLKS